jgi:hypothetical protein
LWRTGILSALALDTRQTDYICSAFVNKRPEVPSGCFVAPMTIRGEDVSLEITVAGMSVSIEKAAFFDVSNIGYFPPEDFVVDHWL